MNNFDIENKQRREKGICSRYAMHPKGKDPDWIISTIADCDFPSPKPIVDEMVKEISKGNLIYTWAEHILQDVAIDWNKKFHNVSFTKDEMVWGAAGVVQLIAYALQAFSKEGDEVILQTPAYAPFFFCINNNKRKIVENKLIRTGNTYVMDFDALDKQMQSAKVMLLCSPHNPIGRVWTAEELKKLITLARKHNVKIICDSIWQDLVYGDHKMTHLESIDFEYAKENVVLITSWSKTFNLGGTQHGYAIVRNQSVRDKIWAIIGSQYIVATYNVGTIAMIDAIGKREDELIEWVDEAKKLFERNAKILDTLEQRTNGKIVAIKNEGMFVTLIDFSKAFDSKAQMDEYLTKCKVGFSAGEYFGKEYFMFKRINFGLPTHVIQEIVDRLVNNI